MREFAVALALLAIGVIGIALFLLRNHTTRRATTELAATISLQICIAIPIVFVGGLLLRIRFGEFRQIATRLTAITVFCAAIALWLPLGMYVAAIAFVALMIGLCRTEVYEAVALALLYLGVRFLVGVAMFIATVG